MMKHVTMNLIQLELIEYRRNVNRFICFKEPNSINLGNLDLFRLSVVEDLK